MRFSYRTLLTAAITSTMIAMAGCGDKSSTTATQKTDGKTASASHLNLSNGSELETLDPQKASDAGAFTVIRQMFIGLTTSDATGKTIPSAAESWSDQDSKVWTFKLKKDLKWSNGDPMTAHDFVYALRRLTDPATASPYGGYLVDIQVTNAKAISEGKAKPDTLGVKAIDDHTLQITLDNPVPYVADLLTLPVTYPIHQKSFEQHGSKWVEPTNLVVSGAYKLKDWQVNSHLTLEKNPQYHEKDKATITTVSFLPITDTAELNRYKTGDIDVTTGIPPELFAKTKQEHGNEVRSDPRLCSFYIEYNTTKAPFDDARVRQALSMVVDRNVITDQILGRGELPIYQFTPPALQGMTQINPEWANLDKAGRAEAAKKLLTEAGYSATNPLKFEILYTTGETAKRLTTAIASMMEQQLGMVKVDMLNQEWKTSLDTRRQGKFQTAFAGWCADYNEPSSFYNMFRTGNGNNSGKYSNPEYDRLLDQTLAAGATSESRIKLYHQAEQLLQKDNPAIFLYVPVSNRLVKSNIEAASLSDPLVNWQVKDWVIKP